MMYDTNTITAIATCVLAFAAVFGGCFALRQLRAIRRSREMQFSVEVMQQLRAPEWIARYRLLYDSPRNAGLQETLPWRQDLELVLDRLEWIGITVARGSVPIQLAALLIGGLPLRVWYMLSEYVERRRAERGHYARNTEDLVRRTLKFQIVHQPYTEWTKLKIRGKDSVELVPELIKMKLLSKRELKWAKLKRRCRWQFKRKLRVPDDDWSKLRWRLWMDLGISILEARKVAIFAPHEDDAELACGGTISKRSRVGLATHVVYLTDGRNSHLVNFGIKEGPTPSELQELRTKEAEEAQSLLGNSLNALHFFAYEDGKLFHYREEAVKKTVAFLRAFRPDLILVPYRNDRHPDHLATYDIVARATQEIKLPVAAYEYFVWMFDSIPDRLKRILAEIGIARELSLKKEAISMFKTQITKYSEKQPRPVLSDEFLENFYSGKERFLPSSEAQEPMFVSMIRMARLRVSSYYIWYRRWRYWTQTASQRLRPTP